MLSIFLTNLEKYNAGQLVGKWVDLPCDDLENLVDELSGGGEDELFISDYSTELDLKIGEYEDLENLNELARQYEDLEDWQQDTVKAYLEATGDTVLDLETALDKYEDCSFYPGYDLEDVARELVDECYDLPEFVQRYFDYAAFARDLGYDGYTEVSNGVIYIG